MSAPREQGKKTITDPKVALVKVQAWCAYQERCQQEVRDKLYSWGLWPDAVESIIAELISKNFINEQRFAVLYAGGKFRVKKWGRIRIRLELKKRQIPEGIIRSALAEIDNTSYHEALYKLAASRWKSEKEKHPLKKKMKVMRYLVSRGYESDLVSDYVNELNET